MNDILKNMKIFGYFGVFMLQVIHCIKYHSINGILKNMKIFWYFGVCVL